jgi:hypothetical protein
MIAKFELPLWCQHLERVGSAGMKVNFNALCRCQHSFKQQHPGMGPRCVAGGGRGLAAGCPDSLGSRVDHEAKEEGWRPIYQGSIWWCHLYARRAFGIPELFKTPFCFVCLRHNRGHKSTTWQARIKPAMHSVFFEGDSLKREQGYKREGFCAFRPWQNLQRYYPVIGFGGTIL